MPFASKIDALRNEINIFIYQINTLINEMNDSTSEITFEK